MPYAAAKAALAQTEVASRIEGISVADVMERDPVAIPEAASIEQALDTRWDESLAALYGSLEVGRLDARRSQAERVQAQQGALQTLELAANNSKDEQQRLLTLAERQRLAAGGAAPHEEHKAADQRIDAEVVAAGRLPCPLCGQPLDPQGHICPRRNGHYVN